MAIEKIDKNNARNAVTSLLSGFPVNLGSVTSVEVPTIKYFEYTLAKILAHAHIMLRLVICSKKCALYFVHFLQTGHYVEVSTIFIGLLGHVWYHARQCLLKMEQFYNKLVTFTAMFPNKNSSHEVDSSDIPANLAFSIGEDWKEEVSSMDEESRAKFESSTASSLDAIGDVRNTLNEELLKPRKVHPLKIVPQKLETECDIGEVISRETMEPASKSTPVVTSKRSLMDFLKTENELRIKKGSKSLTKAISQFYWEKFRQLMERKSKMPNVNIKAVFDREWQQFLLRKA